KLLKFLKQRVKGDLKFHHELRITLTDCPNACSQPQIKDIGIIGAISPLITDEPCTLCKACVEICKENAVTINTKSSLPEIGHNLCLDSGQCVDVCPTRTLAEGKKGFRVQLGGKLGRHPVLATELPGIYTEDEVIKIVKDCTAFYKKFNESGERFAELFQKHDFESFMNR
ncbi:MAG: 4Fe-4S dicluster domain-containing protein, partial [Desulfobacterales bacterium]|nr:4Fe-4S dicluster domain-containing protein [Desulfobacterales bacterium]